MEETEDTQETLGAWDKLAEFFLDDDQSRWKAIRWITAIVGALGAADLVFFKAPVDEAVFLMGFALLLMSILWLAWYTSFSRSQKEKRAATFMTRRDLIWQGASLLAFLAAVRVQRAAARTVERKLREASQKPLNPQSNHDAREVISRAQAAGIQVAPATVEQVGKKFAYAGRDNPEAWDTALQFVAYKSFLNTTLAIRYRQVGTPGEIVTTKYETRTAPGFGPPVFRVLGAVPLEEAAQFSVIGEPDINAGSDRGNDWIIVEGGGVILDGMRLRKVIFRSVYILYSGGPLEMYDVYFFNCTFSIEQKPNGIGLLTAALKPSPATNFIAS